MSYHHRRLNGDEINLPAGKVVCVGRNFAAHAEELNNPLPDEPVLFLKPASSLLAWEKKLPIPTSKGEVHYELELAVLIGKTLTHANNEEAMKGVVAVGLGLDLTLREKQQALKEKGLPWERAKAFDGSCTIGPWIPLPSIEWLQQAEFRLTINKTLRQEGKANLMMWPVVDLLVEISKEFTLQSGDVVLTGTPAGVGPLNIGDQIVAELDNLISIKSKIVASE